MHEQIMRGDSKTSQGEVLTQVPTSVNLTAEQFERLYLSPMMHRQPKMAKNLGNPTPLGVGAFVLTATPIATCLMGWRGAGGGGAALSGVLIMFGGILLVISSILEFILGNTFSSVTFGHLGGFCLAFGTTMLPSFNAAAAYSPDGNSTLAGLQSPGFLDTFAFFFLLMALLMVIYAVCATRTNIVFVMIFSSLIFTFSLLAASYWKMGQEDEVLGERLAVGAGASLFAAAMLGYYLLAAQLLDSVGFPFVLPVGDMTAVWARLDRQKNQNLGADDYNGKA